MTYNVLAQSLIDKNMHLYRNTEALCWESRRQLLLRELREARADIVCLQEVEDEHYHNWFLPNMSSLGIRKFRQKVHKSKVLSSHTTLAKAFLRRQC
jgi:mRNA deadenylase 3'-5' endonuclease subunit Ccr4